MSDHDVCFNLYTLSEVIVLIVAFASAGLILGAAMNDYWLGKEHDDE